MKKVAGAVHNFVTTDSKSFKLCRALFGLFLRLLDAGDKLAGKSYRGDSSHVSAPYCAAQKVKGPSKAFLF